MKLVAAGDIACAPPAIETGTQCRHRRTAQLVRDLAPDAVATLGDAQYEYGEPENYDLVYDPSWGTPFKGITHPATGNHEYQEGPNAYGPTAEGHFGYFGAAAGDPQKGYYSYDLGAWHVFVLNSGAIEYTKQDGPGDPAGDDDCYPVSCIEQAAWLDGQLDLLPNSACVIAYWHHPFVSSGWNGQRRNHDELQPVYDVLYEHRAELALAGHIHNYERFAPIDADGERDPLGVRQFVVGTGGRSLHGGAPLPHHEASENLIDDAFGVLELTLSDGSYSWRFVPEPGTEITEPESGSASCH